MKIGSLSKIKGFKNVKTKKPQTIDKQLFTAIFSSGYQDLNLGPPAPKAGALPGCATSRM
jgi:hypothetical protein